MRGTTGGAYSAEYRDDLLVILKSNHIQSLFRHRSDGPSLFDHLRGSYLGSLPMPSFIPSISITCYIGFDMISPVVPALRIVFSASPQQPYRPRSKATLALVGDLPFPVSNAPYPMLSLVPSNYTVKCPHHVSVIEIRCVVLQYQSSKPDAFPYSPPFSRKPSSSMSMRIPKISTSQRN